MTGAIVQGAVEVVVGALAMMNGDGMSCLGGLPDIPRQALDKFGVCAADLFDSCNYSPLSHQFSPLMPSV